LEVLGLAWSVRNADELLATQNINHRRFAHVGVPHCSNHHSLLPLAKSTLLSDVFDQGEQLASVEQVLSVQRQFATPNLLLVLIIYCLLLDHFLFSNLVDFVLLDKLFAEN
jgi:hypothetical protein